MKRSDYVSGIVKVIGEYQAVQMINSPSQGILHYAPIGCTVKRIYCFLFHRPFWIDASNFFDCNSTYCKVCADAWCASGSDCCFRHFDKQEERPQ